MTYIAGHAMEAMVGTYETIGQLDDVALEEISDKAFTMAEHMLEAETAKE